MSASLESSWDLLMHDLDGYAPDFSIKSTDTAHWVTDRIRNIRVHKMSTQLISNFLYGSTLERSRGPTGDLSRTGLTNVMVKPMVKPSGTHFYFPDTESATRSEVNLGFLILNPKLF